MDRVAAQIWIGGKLPRSFVSEFPVRDLQWDWDGARVGVPTEGILLEYCDPGEPLWLVDGWAHNGAFPELEDWLREHQMPFRRRSEGMYEYLPEWVEFRPDCAVEFEVLTTDGGEPLVLQSELMITINDIKSLQASDLPAEARLEQWDRIAKDLRDLLPPEIPPLPAFEIVDG